MAEVLELPIQSVLIRKKKTQSQAKLDYQERMVGDLDGIFGVVDNLPEKILLCDDVFTSGSTIDAGAKVLKENGVKEVYGWTLARGLKKE